MYEKLNEIKERWKAVSNEMIDELTRLNEVNPRMDQFAPAIYCTGHIPVDAPEGVNQGEKLLVVAGNPKALMRAVCASLDKPDLNAVVKASIMVDDAARDIANSCKN